MTELVALSNKTLIIDRNGFLKVKGSVDTNLYYIESGSLIRPLRRIEKNMQSEKLLQSLIEQTRQIANEVEKLKGIDSKTLTWKENPTSWSILECLEHLNRYGNFYLPEMERQIKKSDTKSEKYFQSGLLGNYFVKSMLPQNKFNKMKTFKDKNPLNTKLDKTVIDKFLGQQTKILDLLHQSRNVSLSGVRVQTSISRLIKLKLGDAFEFVTSHTIRHLNQIERIKEEVKNA